MAALPTSCGRLPSLVAGLNMVLYELSWMSICVFTTLEMPLLKLLLGNMVGYERNCCLSFRFCFPSCCVCLLGALK